MSQMERQRQQRAYCPLQVHLPLKAITRQVQHLLAQHVVSIQSRSIDFVLTKRAGLNSCSSADSAASDGDTDGTSSSSSSPLVDADAPVTVGGAR